MLCWFGIYLGGVITFMIITFGYPHDPISYFPGILFDFVLFPVGLGTAYVSILDLVDRIFSLKFHPYGLAMFLGILSVPMSYATYLIHLKLTLKAQKRKVFLLLLLSLVIFVSANVVACHKIAETPLGLQ